ncbi:unnamed protein product [Ixodes persulcatus]
MTDTKDILNFSISRLMLSGNSRGYPASKRTTRPSLRRLFYRPYSSQRPRHRRRAPPCSERRRQDARVFGRVLRSRPVCWVAGPGDVMSRP